MPFVLAFAGLALVVPGWLGRAGRLPRNNFAGVRTPSTMRSDAAFRLANKVAGLPTMAGGGVALAGAVTAWFVPTDEGVLAVVIVATAGMLALVVGGAAMGVRAVTRTATGQEPPSTR
uniref:SdpI family protein n=1 Tax=Nonomuraea pusilla TaxID=46177 RepID=UPI0007C7A623|nr:SdpI family protein [Nonomuraea pusilla]